MGIMHSDLGFLSMVLDFLEVKTAWNGDGGGVDGGVDGNGVIGRLLFMIGECQAWSACGSFMNEKYVSDCFHMILRALSTCTAHNSILDLKHKHASFLMVSQKEILDLMIFASYNYSAKNQIKDPCSI